MNRSLILTLAFTALAACHDDGPDDLVGATCRDDFDCAERCEEGSEFPGGFCTISCRGDYDCTDETVCADTREGVCLYTCRDDRDCAFLGPYYCFAEGAREGGTVYVCMGE